MNTLLLMLLALLWAGGAYVVCCLRALQRFAWYRTGRTHSVLLLLNLVGAGIFTAWLVRVLFVPVERWGIADLFIFLLLAAGFFALTLSRPRSGGPKGFLLLEKLADRYGVFHLRLEGKERSGLNWAGHTLGELDLRKKNLLVLAIIRNDEIIPFPKGVELLRDRDDLLIFGVLDDLSR